MSKDVALYRMSYILIKQGHVLSIIDQDDIVDGPEARGHDIVIKNAMGEIEEAIFIARGRESELLSMKDVEQVVPAKRGKGRPRKEQKHLVSTNYMRTVPR